MCLTLVACGGSSTSEDTIKEVNRFPVIELADTKLLVSGKSLTLSPTVSDPDGDTLTYEWHVGDAEITVDDTTILSATFDFPVADDDRTYTITLNVTDVKGNKSQQVVSVLVKASVKINRAPVITLPATQVVKSEQSVVFSPKVDDLENDVLSISWSSDSEDVTFSDKSILAPTVTFPKTDVTQQVILTISVIDIADNTTAQDIVISIEPKSTVPIDNPPLLAITNVPSGSSGENIEVKATVISSYAIEEAVWTFNDNEIVVDEFTELNTNEYEIVFTSMLPNVDVFTSMPISLEVTTNNEQKASISEAVSVSSNLTPSLTISLPNKIEIDESQTKTITPTIANTHSIDSYSWRWLTSTKSQLLNNAMLTPTIISADVVEDIKTILELTVTMGDVVKKIETEVVVKNDIDPITITLSLSRVIAVEGHDVEINVVTNNENDIASATWIFEGFDNISSVEEKTKLNFTVPKVFNSTVISVIYTALLNDGSKIVKNSTVSVMGEAAVRNSIVIRAPDVTPEIYNAIPYIMPILLEDELSIIDSIEVAQPFTVNTFKPIGISRTSQLVTLTLETNTILFDHYDFMNLQLKVGSLVIDFPITLSMKGN